MSSLSNDGISLTAFPSEVWPSLSYFLDGEDLVLLKITGSKLLWGTITQKGSVTAVYLGFSDLNLKSWPASFSELPSVQRYVIHGKDKAWWHRIQPTLIKMPRTLKYLEIQNVYDPTFSLTDSGVLLFEEHVPELRVLVLPQERNTKLLAIQSLPSLTSLTVAYWDLQRPLPVNLEHLRAADATAANEVRSTIQFPVRLRSLSFEMFDGSQDFIRNLPPCVEELAYCSEMLPFDKLQDLPANLRCLRIHTLNSSGYMTDLPESIPFPSCLDTLSLNQLPVEFWPNLPSTLRSLYITEMLYEHAMRVETLIVGGKEVEQDMFPLQLLPVSLTALHVEVIDSEDEDEQVRGGHDCLYLIKKNDSILQAPGSNPRLFPPKLITLILPQAQIFCDTAYLLPATLTELELANIDTWTAHALRGQLKRLTVQATAMCSQLIQNLPRSLVSLTLLAGDPVLSTWFVGQDRTVRLERLKEVAPELVKSKSTPWRKLCCLPPTLKFIRISINNLRISFFEQNLPRLHTLRLEGKITLGDSFLDLLPPGLTDLKISNAPSVNGRSFRRLGKKLAHLNLPRCSDVSDLDFLSLPRNLKSLKIPLASDFTEAFCENLPKTLLLLNVKNSMLPSTIASKLPRSLFSTDNDEKPTVKFALWSVIDGQKRVYYNYKY